MAIYDSVLSYLPVQVCQEDLEALGDQDFDHPTQTKIQTKI